MSKSSYSYTYSRTALVELPRTAVKAELRRIVVVVVVIVVDYLKDERIIFMISYLFRSNELPKN